MALKKKREFRPTAESGNVDTYGVLRISWTEYKTHVWVLQNIGVPE